MFVLSRFQSIRKPTPPGCRSSPAGKISMLPASVTSPFEFFLSPRKPPALAGGHEGPLHLLGRGLTGFTAEQFALLKRFTVIFPENGHPARGFRQILARLRVVGSESHLNMAADADGLIFGVCLVKLRISGKRCLLRFSFRGSGRSPKYS
jgi:hypothetical protein